MKKNNGFDKKNINSQARKEYNILSKEDLKDLSYTGEWELDKRRFIKEYEKNIEIFDHFDQENEDEDQLY